MKFKNFWTKRLDIYKELFSKLLMVDAYENLKTEISLYV